MTAEQRGWYIQLLAEAWDSDEPGFLPKGHPVWWLAGAKDEQTFAKSSTLVLQNFKRDRRHRLYNPRLLAERKIQIAWREKSSEAGKKSAKARSTQVRPAPDTPESRADFEPQSGSGQNGQKHLTSDDLMISQDLQAKGGSDLVGTKTQPTLKNGYNQTSTLQSSVFTLPSLSSSPSLRENDKSSNNGQNGKAENLEPNDGDNDQSQNSGEFKNLFDAIHLNRDRLRRKTEFAAKYLEARWIEAGKPVGRELETFLHVNLNQCKALGMEYPRAVLLRLKQLQRA